MVISDFLQSITVINDKQWINRIVTIDEQVTRNKVAIIELSKNCFSVEIISLYTTNVNIDEWMTKIW